MTWIILIAILCVILITSLYGQKRVAWADNLRRLNPGVQRRAEWMAPDYVVQQVRNDYLIAVRWLQLSVASDVITQWDQAPRYLSGRTLQRHQLILRRHYTQNHSPRYIETLAARHYVTVRHFSEDGAACLVIDHQRNRRITTIDNKNQKSHLSQRIDDEVLVYRMTYDRTSRRWKIDAYIQSLPIGKLDHNGQLTRRIKLMSSLPPTMGRDN